MKLRRISVVLLVSLMCISCSVKYSFTGASISTTTRSFQVNYFQNNSTLVEPGIDRDFTNKLIDLLINQTSLELVKSDGDLILKEKLLNTEYLLQLQLLIILPPKTDSQLELM